MFSNHLTQSGETIDKNCGNKGMTVHVLEIN